MRALKVMLFATAMFTILSCSKDDDNPEVDKNMVLGEWNLTEFSYSGTTSVSEGSETASLSYSADAFDLDARVIFEDNSNYSTNGSYSITLKTIFDGETMVEDYNYPNIDGRGTYKIQGNKMITNPQGAEGQLITASEAVIQELTPNKMVLVIEQNSVQEAEGMEIEITLDMIQVLTR